MGYGPPLPAPIPAVQATLSAIDLPNLHKFIQETDSASLNECEEEGVHAPLLLDSLDLALWTSIFVTAATDPEKSIANIRKAHAKLADLLIEDEREAVRMDGLALKVEAALKAANDDALESTSNRNINLTQASESGSAPTAHPLLAKLKISPADRTALEDFNENIQCSQNEKEKNTLVNTKGPVVPLKPPRCVELLVTDCNHKMWIAGNTNLLAPITVPMWKHWAGLTDADVENFRKQALNNVGVLRAPIDLLPAFSLNMFEHSKCTTTEVKLHTKQDLPTGYNRKDSHLSELWNVQRPYMRCLCSPKANNGCKGSIIWFDHAIWLMVNKLDMFFANQPNNTTRLAAFMLWLSGAARIAVKAAVVFQIGREQMVRAAIQLADNPHQKLLADLNEAPIAGKIERLMKGPKFSLSHPASPSQAPSPYKKQRFNLNASPTFGNSSNGGGRGRTSPGARGSREGGRSFRGRGMGRHAFPRRYPTSGSQTQSDSCLSNNDGSDRVEAVDSHSPMKSRVLLWDEEV